MSPSIASSSNARPEWALALAALAALAACTIANPDYQRSAADASVLDSAGMSGDGSPGLDGATPTDAPAGSEASPGSEDAPGSDAPRPEVGAEAAADRPGGSDVRIDPPPLGLWRFDDVGRDSAHDESGNDLHGKLVDLDPGKAWVTGRRGGWALEFAPSAALPGPGVELPPNPRLTNLQRFTIAAWIYRTETSRPMQMSIFSQQQGTTSDEIFNLCIVSDRFWLYLPYAGGAPRGVTSSDPVPFGTWIHVAASFDGATARLYRNGQPVNSIAYPRALPMESNPVFIGLNVNASARQPFVGYLDDVMFFDRELTDGQIATLAQP